MEGSEGCSGHQLSARELQLIYGLRVNTLQGCVDTDLIIRFHTRTHVSSPHVKRVVAS